jgi:hypothetical protein
MEYFVYFFNDFKEYEKNQIVSFDEPIELCEYNSFFLNFFDYKYFSFVRIPEDAVFENNKTNKIKITKICKIDNNYNSFIFAFNQLNGFGQYKDFPRFCLFVYSRNTRLPEYIPKKCACLNKEECDIEIQKNKFHKIHSNY